MITEMRVIRDEDGYSGFISHSGGLVEVTADSFHEVVDELIDLAESRHDMEDGY